METMKSETAAIYIFLFVTTSSLYLSLLTGSWQMQPSMKGYKAELVLPLVKWYIQ